MGGSLPGELLCSLAQEDGPDMTLEQVVRDISRDCAFHFMQKVKVPVAYLGGGFERYVQ